MNRFFDGAMRHAALLLFVLALLLLLLGIYSSVQAFLAMRSMMGAGGAGPGAPGIGVLLQPLLTTVSLAAIPYFGAAILWRMDRGHRARPAEVA